MNNSVKDRLKEQRVSMFISHKVATHKQAAARIKGILESRTERLDVYICEDIPAGDEWLKWVKEHIASSRILLVLVPHKCTDLTWIADEIGRFESACPGGRLVVLKRASDPVPDIVRERQIIDASKAQLQELFLEPLYRHATFTGLEAPLNPRVTNSDLTRDAQELEHVISGIVDTHLQYFGEFLVIDTVDADLTNPGGLTDTPVWAPNGCGQILNWNRRSFSWAELRKRAEEDRGKGTFWVSEIEQVMFDVARQDVPRVMSSTFRGRGALGQIFQPQLDHAEFVEDRPVRFHFVFREVLAPELVRGRGEIGDVFNLLRIAGRVRWEVLDPFVMKRWLSKDFAGTKTKEEQSELMGKIAGSLRTIEMEVERHRMLAQPVGAFSGLDPNPASEILSERESIKKMIDDSISNGDFEGLMKELAKKLELNSRIMEILADRFLQLVREDRENLLKVCKDAGQSYTAKLGAV